MILPTLGSLGAAFGWLIFAGVALAVLMITVLQASGLLRLSSLACCKPVHVHDGGVQGSSTLAVVGTFGQGLCRRGHQNLDVRSLHLSPPPFRTHRDVSARAKPRSPPRSSGTAFNSKVSMTVAPTSNTEKN